MLRKVSLLVVTVVAVMTLSSSRSSGQGGPAPVLDVIPLPRTVEARDGDGFVLTPQTVIYVQDRNADAQRIGQYLSSVI